MAGAARPPGLKRLAAVASMMVLGPVLGWLLFSLLGYSRRPVYLLTLVSGAVFGVVWVPLYGLGLWGLLEGLL